MAAMVVTLVAPAPAAHADSALDSEEATFCNLINDYRGQNGLQPLRVSFSLDTAADWLSTDMAQKNYFSHTDSLGRDAFQRMTAFGYGYATSKGENIAAGNSTAMATFEQWRTSPPHNTNMLNANYKVIGIGRAYDAAGTYGWYWTTDFGGFVDGGSPCPKVDQTISFPPLANVVYGDPALTAAATASSGLPVSFTSTTPSVCTTSGTNGAITLVGYGTCTIRADQAGDSTRNPAPPVVNSFTFSKKPLTVRAVDAIRPVSTQNPAFTATYSGFVNGETLATSGVSGAPSCTTTATPQSPAGAYPISCAVGTLASANYTFTMAPGTLTVSNTYNALSPARLADTRPGQMTVDGAFAGGGAVPGGSTANLTVTGRGGVPATGVGAVVLNVTAVDPTTPSYLTVWPAGETRPNASNLNFAAGQTIPNLVIAKVGANGQVSIYNNAGATHLVVDVAGWFPTGG